MPLEHAAILEPEHIQRFFARRRIQIANGPQKRVRVLELIGNEGEQRRIVTRSDERSRYPPELEKTAVVSADVSVPIDNQDPVRGRVERRLEERERPPELLRRLPLRGDVHRGAHATDGGALIIDERLDQYLEPPVLALILERLSAAGERGEMVRDHRLARIVTAHEIVDGRPYEPLDSGRVEHRRPSMHVSEPQLAVGRPDGARRLPEDQAEVFLLPLSRSIRWHGGSQLFEPAPPKIFEHCTFADGRGL
jgi:hypothetical protein